jgi:prepilin-type N-terminal cleavage/methylation domain-containing protein
MYKKAFTLIELLLVIAIVAIIFAFSAPYALNFYYSNILNDAQRNIVSALEQARHYAILQKNDSNFGVYLVPGSYTIFQTPDLNYENRVEAQDEVFPMIDQISFATTTVIFSKLTGVVSTTSTTTLSYSGLNKVIVVEESGNIYEAD